MRVFRIHVRFTADTINPRKSKAKHRPPAVKRGQLIGLRVKQTPMPKAAKTRICSRYQVGTCVREGSIQIKNNRFHAISSAYLRLRCNLKQHQVKPFYLAAPTHAAKTADDKRKEQECPRI